MVEAYNQSAATLNLLRGFSTGGYAGLQRVTQWNLEFMGNSDEGQVRQAVGRTLFTSLNRRISAPVTLSCYDQL